VYMYINLHVLIKNVAVPFNLYSIVYNWLTLAKISRFYAICVHFLSLANYTRYKTTWSTVNARFETNRIFWHVSVMKPWYT
jgi:hypothetical protein